MSSLTVSSAGIASAPRGTEIKPDMASAGLNAPAAANAAAAIPPFLRKSRLVFTGFEVGVTSKRSATDQVSAYVRHKREVAGMLRHEKCASANIGTSMRGRNPHSPPQARVRPDLTKELQFGVATFLGVEA